GCFAFRPQRMGGRLSTHSWGIAIDLNPESNAQGTAGSMDRGVVEIFKSAGFAWGGNWQGRCRDPMHFQFCTGY
ncbi:MAG TPA: M15 family metallopeptidase, partial [Terriglobales bacterium]|nr:M15 family metallopeptidase [Terriglobales bacterium]